MGKPLPGRHRRRKAFLHALALGAAPGEAAARAGIRRSTLYAWRRDGPRFRAAWERAAAFAQEMHEGRFKSALFERALAGVEVPVVRDGRVIGTRTRDDDRALMLAWRWLCARRAAEAPPPAAVGADDTPKFRAVIGDCTKEAEAERWPREERSARLTNKTDSNYNL